MSVDVWILARPAAAFRWLAAQPATTGWRIAARRPLLLTLVLCSVISLGGAGTLTARLVLPPMIYWVFVPITEILALLLVVRGGRRRLPWSILIDQFFAGHAAWMLLVLAIGGVIAFTPPVHWWMVLTRIALSGLALVVCWSAYIDFCFFRQVIGATRGRALRDVLVHRVITWLIVFSVFVTQELTPWGLARELSEAVAEVFR